MSMINDALRRASSAAPDEQQPAGIDPGSCVPPPLPGSAIPPNEGCPPLLHPVPPRKSSLPILLLALLLLCLAGAAGVYLWERNHRPPLPKQNAQGQTLAAAKLSEPAPARPVAQPVSAQPTQQVAAVAAAPTNAGTIAPAPATAPPTNVVAAAAPLPPVQFPPLRLQSIFYRKTNPSVMINGRTFYVNDHVQGVQVAAIDPASVTLVLSGRTNILTLR